jgi:hypothetical protein
MATLGRRAMGDDAACQHGPERSLSSPPGNLEGAGQGTQFCLHNCSHPDGGSLNSDCLLQFQDISCSDSTSRSSRSSTLSFVSTSLTVSDCDCAHSTASAPLRLPRSRSSVAAQRSRRDREQLHAARLQRSRRNGPLLGSKSKHSKHSKAHWNRRQSGNSGTADALAALEPVNEHSLTKM